VSAWCAEDHHFLLKSLVHRSLLGAAAWFPGARMIHSSAYHPQTDGKTERVNQFSYNNSYQESLRMAPFEALYDHRCRTHVNWIEPGERTIFGPDLVIEAEEIVHHIQSNLKAAKARQESYANK
jgi:hypothetical protein